MNKKLKQAYGNWVEGDRFWDRESDIKLLINRIEEGAHIMLVAQRRMGKTSLMREISLRLQEKYICLFVDFQKACDSPDAMVELSLAMRPHKSLWDKTKDVFSNIIRTIFENIEEINIKDIGITLRAGLTAGNWKEKGDQLFSVIASEERPVILLMDEVPLMVNRMLKGEDFAITHERRAAVDEFMSWLRDNSLRHQNRVRIVVSGSIGFEPILNQARLSATINNFSPFELKPWDEPTAISCLDALANEYGVKFKEGAEAAIVKRLGCCIPHHVQMFFTQVYERCTRRQRMEFYADEVNDIYESEMLGIRGHAELTHYEERLKLVLGPEIFPLALEMLSETAVAGCLKRESLMELRKGYTFKKRSVQDAQEEIIRVLEHDGYIRQDVEDYVFESHLLRDWWLKRYGFFHVPVLKRGV